MAGTLDEEIEADMKKFRDEVRKLNTKVGAVDKDLKNTFKELKISEEIKDTVFRDSKRVHNLNDRLGDMEKDLKALTSKKKKDYDSEIKALIKRFDKLDTELAKKVKKAVSYEFESQLPPPPVEEPEPEPVPKGAKIRKTTKKKTTKRRKTKKS
jgi:predicted  nucleic acid-binding Zn-ribbon protein